VGDAPEHVPAVFRPGDDERRCSRVFPPPEQVAAAGDRGAEVLLEAARSSVRRIQRWTNPLREVPLSPTEPSIQKLDAIEARPGARSRRGSGQEPARTDLHGSLGRFFSRVYPTCYGRKCPLFILATIVLTSAIVTGSRKVTGLSTLEPLWSVPKRRTFKSWMASAQSSTSKSRLGFTPQVAQFSRWWDGRP
jgi:hypothetical protein